MTHSGIPVVQNIAQAGSDIGSGNILGAVEQIGAPVVDLATAVLAPEALPIVAPAVGALTGGLQGGVSGALTGGLEGAVVGQLGGTGDLAPLSSGDTSFASGITSDVANTLGVPNPVAAAGLGAVGGAATSAITGGNPLTGALAAGVLGGVGSEVSGLLGGGGPDTQTGAQFGTVGVADPNASNSFVTDQYLAGGTGQALGSTIDPNTGAAIGLTEGQAAQSLGYADYASALAAGVPQSQIDAITSSADVASGSVAAPATAAATPTADVGLPLAEAGPPTVSGILGGTTAPDAGTLSLGSLGGTAISPTGFALPTASQAGAVATPPAGAGGAGAGALDTGGPISDFSGTDLTGPDDAAGFGAGGVSLYDPSNLNPVPAAGTIPSPAALSGFMGQSSNTAASEDTGGVPLPADLPVGKATPTNDTSSPGFLSDLTSGNLGGVAGDVAGTLGKLGPGALIGGGILGVEALTGGLTPKATPAQTALTSQAAAANATAAALQAPLLTGQLPAGIQDAINQATAAAQAKIRSEYADAGLSGSSMETQDLNSVATNAVAQGYQLAVQMAQVGLSDANLSADIYNNLMGVQLSQDQELTNAVVGFATALASPSVKLSLGA